MHSYSLQQSEKWVRPNGVASQDNVCHGNGPCTDLITGGTRYIIKDEECCVLGTEADGCGALRPDWLVYNNATFVGTKKTTDGNMVQGWEVTGFSKNTWWQNVGTEVPFSLVQGGFVDVYDGDSFATNSSWEKRRFAVPEHCVGAVNCASTFPCQR